MGTEKLKTRTIAIKNREKVKNDVDIGVNDIQVTTGVTEAMKMFLGASLDVGDEILVPDPTYQLYVSLTMFYGGIPKAYTTIEEGWKPDTGDIREKITEKTKVITVINPNNPTGALYDKGILKKIVDIAGEHEIPILSDEVYDMIVYEKSHTSPGSLTKDIPVVVMNGFSKGYFATGWRLGYIYTVDPENRLFEIKEAIRKLARIRLSPNTPAQKAAATGSLQVS